MILLDTDICIEILRKNEKVISSREKDNDDIGISFISVGELYFGAERSAKPKKNMRLIEEFLITINIIHSDISIMIKFGELKAYLKNNSILLPDADLLIAATTFIKAERLITGNVKHFEHFPNLSIENWIE